MKTLENLALDLYTLSSAVAGPEPWSSGGFYAASFTVQTSNRDDYEALIRRLDTEHANHPDMKKTVSPSFITHEAATYLIGDNTSWGLRIRIVGPMADTARQDRITALEAELAQLKGDRS